MPHVISISRRTDIPAFYTDWLVSRLKAGVVFVRHPFVKKLLRVSLRPEDVSAVVFWSKNYSPLLSRLEAIEKTTLNLFFHFTITANRELEFHTPDHRDAIRDYIYLAGRYSPEQLVWRFDPIAITDKLSFDVHEERFARCAELLQGHARKCIVSFVHPYKKVLTNLKKYTDHSLVDLSEESKREHARRLAERAAACGIRLYACCNDYLVSDKIQKASCIDGRFLSELFKTPIETRPAGTRRECACTRSVDIGAYDTCAHGCVYCYANADKDRAAAALQRHNAAWNALHMQVDEEQLESGEEQEAFKY
jgi:Domain of unknown function (DUF1848)